MHICGEDIHDNITFSRDNIAFYYNLQNGEGSISENSSYILMQYTGLKDKNGVEIYEGDIVEFYIADKMWKAKIGFDGGGFTIDFGRAFTYLCAYDIERNLFEVIGNIHDNKELLEG